MRNSTPLLIAVLTVGVLACDRNGSNQTQAPEQASLAEQDQATAAPEHAAEPAPQKQPQSTAAAQSGERAPLPDRDPELAHQLVTEQDALLLDVRTPEEYQSGHLEDAMLVPHDQVEARIDEILQAQGGDKSKPIVVYCRSGGRASKAKEVLVEHGFDQVTNLGGQDDWCETC